MKIWGSLTWFCTEWVASLRHLILEECPKDQKLPSSAQLRLSYIITVEPATQPPTRQSINIAGKAFKAGTELGTALPQLVLKLKHMAFFSHCLGHFDIRIKQAGAELCQALFQL